jgi:hypothetical protein
MKSFTVQLSLAGLAVLALAACSRPTEFASEANAVYEKGGPPPLPPASVTLDSITPVEPPADTAAPDGAAPPDAAGGQFPDYKPKTTADTVTDYRSSVSGDIAALPSISNPAALALAFVEWKGRAAASPGASEQGAIQLGADPQEYRPSDAELVAAEAGDRLSAALNGADEATKASVAAVLPDAGARAYKRFDFRHSDVMGSGRYFYASPPKDASIPGG